MIVIAVLVSGMVQAGLLLGAYFWGYWIGASMAKKAAFKAIDEMAESHQKQMKESAEFYKRL